MEIGTRVKYIGPEREWYDGAPNPGHRGTYKSPGKEFLNFSGESNEEREKRRAEYSAANSMIHWDGITYPWNCPNEHFEAI